MAEVQPSRSEAASAASPGKTIGDVFASMMSSPMAARAVAAQTPPGAAPAPMGFAPAPARPAVGRNDPCPCGSGKKYKKCCGKGLV